MRKRKRKEQKINEDAKKWHNTHNRVFWIVTEMGRGREKESKGSDGMGREKESKGSDRYRERKRKSGNVISWERKRKEGKTYL